MAKNKVTPGVNVIVISDNYYYAQGIVELFNKNVPEPVNMVKIIREAQAGILEAMLSKINPAQIYVIFHDSDLKVSMFRNVSNVLFLHVRQSLNGYMKNIKVFLERYGIQVNYPEPVNYHPSLSRREIEVLELLGRGYTDQQISWLCKINVKTVSTHRCSIIKKLKLKNKIRLYQFCLNYS